MVELALLKNSRLVECKAWPKPAGAHAMTTDIQYIEPKARVY